MTERWLPVVGYEGFYEVSDQGRVRSLKRVVPTRNGRTLTVHGRILVITFGGDMHGRVKLHAHGGLQQRTIHSLVAQAFIGPRPPGLVACHNNGDPHDNRAENLRYDTQSENLRDGVRHGHHPWASRTHCKNGHEYTPENTRPYRGRRACRACEREASRRRRLTGKE